MYDMDTQQCIDLGVFPCSYDNAQAEHKDVQDSHAVLISQKYVRDWQDAAVVYRDTLKDHGDCHIIGFPLPTVDNFDDDETGKKPVKTYT